MESEIARMRARNSKDLSFGTLHEISHLFDQERWLFEGEALANFKIPYALHICGATAAPADRSLDVRLNAKNFVEEMYRVDGRLEEDRGRFCASLAAKLIEIAETIGWNAVTKTFQTFPPIDSETRIRKFEIFISRLGEVSGFDVYAMISAREWEIIRRELV